MNKKIKTIISVAVFLIIIILLILPKLSSNSTETKTPERTSKGPLSVTAFIASPENIANNVSTNGSTMSNDEVELRSEISGKVIKVAFNEGSRVAKGQLLIKIDDSELQVQLAKAKFRLKLYEDEEFRQRKLVEKEAISQEDYDRALNDLNLAKSEVDLIKTQILKTEIKAPFSGVIGLKNVSVGSYLTPSNTIANLQNNTPVKIDFSVPEKYSGYLAVNDVIKFTLQGKPDTYTAKVYAIEPKINPQTRTIQLRALYPNAKGEIFPGAFANILLVLKEIKNAIMIPSQAVVPELKGQSVFVFKNGKAATVKVEIGIRDEKSVQIISGLSAGDTVITSGILQLKPNMPVKISQILNK